MIAKVWAEKLGIDNIGIYDNFFDLGGHSLTAVKVIVQIKKLSGKYLPLGTLIKYPTIARLAEALANEINDISTKCLVPLKPGGSKPPLYIVHGLGSTVFKFYDLAHQLDADQPVFGFQAKGLDGLDQPAESIEDMASQYIKELLEYDSLGPYNLSGYSFGGIVAFEMSKQLKSLGKEVNILALFDSFLIEHEQMDAGIKKNLVKYLSRIKKFLFTFKLLVSRPKRTIDHKLFTIKRQLNTLLGRKIGNEVGLDDNFDQIGKMMSVHRHVKSTYRLKKQDLTIHLFKANINATYLDDFQYLGWKPFASQVIIHEIEGDHIEIFEPGINLRFAKSLQTLLNSTDSK
ncbi:MAG: hypothetical protein EOP45_03530 [Sphingobacteriaceae bacterium]|nr:MAG: hypothetical protein EOP45_03530 [Sphingobacteriaceae bacterium]